MLPEMPEQELSDAIGWQLSRQRSNTASTQYHDHYDLGISLQGDKRSHSVIAVTASADTIQAKLAFARSQRLSVAQIGDQTGLLARICPTLVTDITPHEIVAVINVGQERTVIMLILGDRLLDARSLNQGSNWIDEQVQRLDVICSPLPSDRNKTTRVEAAHAPETLQRISELIVKQWEQELRIATHQAIRLLDHPCSDQVQTLAVFGQQQYTHALVQAACRRPNLRGVDLTALLLQRYAHVLESPDETGEPVWLTAIAQADPTLHNDLEGSQA